jgi:hypothetical protein
MVVGTAYRMFLVWVLVVVVDGVASAALSPSDTAGYLSLAGFVVVLVGTWVREHERGTAA